MTEIQETIASKLCNISSGGKSNSRHRVLTSLTDPRGVKYLN